MVLFDRRKVSKTKDEELMEIQKERIGEDIFYQNDSMILVSDFYDLVGKKVFRIEDY